MNRSAHSIYAVRDRAEPRARAPRRADGRRPPSAGADPKRAPVTTFAPDLVASLTRLEAEAAERFVRAPVHALPVGRLPNSSVTAWRHGALGALVVAGMLVRRGRTAGTTVTELFGSDDLIAPEVSDDERWHVVAPARIAVLDECFAGAAMRLPGLSRALLVRALGQADHRLDLGMPGLTRVDDRLIVLFCRVAERWGRVTPRGITVTFPVTHRTIAELVGARRPSVTTALSHLDRKGVIRRDGDEWQLALTVPELSDPPLSDNAAGSLSLSLSDRIPSLTRPRARARMSSPSRSGER